MHKTIIATLLALGACSSDAPDPLTIPAVDGATEESFAAARTIANSAAWIIRRSACSRRVAWRRAIA